ncbi:MAG: GH39 family glycosyl hydrolase, partial [Butyricicoccaceae bacterium]
MLTFGNEHRSDTILFIANETGTDSMRWYEGIKIFYILSGTAHIHVEKNDHTLTAEDFLVVNAFELHSILLSENSEILEMCIPLAIISRVFGSSDPHAFDCDSSRCRPEQEQYLATIRRIYADLFRAVYKGHQDNTAYIFSEVYALIDLLSRHFPRQHAIHDPLLRKQNARQLQGILSYINENFRSDLSIHAVAQANFITSNYLSRYFHRMVGTTFTDYLTSVRLSSAYGELVSTSKTITRIALDNGFRSTNAFIKYFKNQYGETPGKLRRDLEENPPAPAHPTDDARIFQALLRHVSKDANANSVAPDITRLELSVNTIHRGKPLSQTWKNLINIGYAREGLQADVQEQLRRIQREIGFRYVRFQGLLDDDMLIYAENEHGEPELDFTLVDLLFDFLLSIGLKPYVELGFVPSLLAYPQTRAFRRSSYLCLPVDEEKWFMLVKELIFHLEARYGSDQLQTWYFTLMSIHCAITDKQQTVVDHAAYYALYRRVYRFLKSRGAGYRVSGPGVYSNAIEEDYLWAFLKNCAADDCLPDQFTLLCFPYDPIHDKDYFRTICAPDLP